MVLDKDSCLNELSQQCFSAGLLWLACSAERLADPKLCDTLAWTGPPGSATSSIHWSRASSQPSIHFSIGVSVGGDGGGGGLGSKKSIGPTSASTSPIGLKINAELSSGPPHKIPARFTLLFPRLSKTGAPLSPGAPAAPTTC
jgi:hypothetical protein